jgi:hypothetical protein
MSEAGPYIICQIAPSIDGKIDDSAMRKIMRTGEYEALQMPIRPFSSTLKAANLDPRARKSRLAILRLSCIGT